MEMSSRAVSDVSYSSIWKMLIGPKTRFQKAGPGKKIQAFFSQLRAESRTKKEGRIETDIVKRARNTARHKAHI